MKRYFFTQHSGLRTQDSRIYRSRLSVLLISLALAATTLAVFWPVQGYDFIDFDDDDYVYQNAQVRQGLSLGGIAWALTATSASNWHPLTWLSHMLDCHIYGLKPGGHHRTSMLFHAANALLLFLILRRMTGAVWRSVFVAALFALHPLRVESVAWVAERKDVLSTLFWMLTMWAYTRYAERPCLVRYLPVFIFLALGLMAKPMLVTLPLVLVLLDFWPLGRLRLTSEGAGQRGFSFVYLRRIWGAGHKIILEKLPLLALSAVSSTVTLMTQGQGGSLRSLESSPLLSRVANALVAYTAYIGKMAFPYPLAILYPYPDRIDPVKAASAFLVLAAGTALILCRSRKHPYLLVGWLWYLGTLLPVIGIIRVGTQAMADRYTYIPQVGLFILIAWGCGDVFPGRAPYRKILGFSAALVLIAMGVATRMQLSLWQNSVTLFTHTLNVTASNYLIHNNLGAHFFLKGNISEAMAQFSRSISIKPDFAGAHSNMGNVLVRQGRHSEAIAEYREALRIKPDFAEVHNNLANALFEQGNSQEAIRHSTEALRLKPEYGEAQRNLKIMQSRPPTPENALPPGEGLPKKGPVSAEEYYRSGNELSEMGKLSEAMVNYSEALRRQPNFPQAHNNLGALLDKQGRIQEAMVHFQESLRFKPDYDDARNNIGVALGRQGKHTEAIIHFQEALRINPRYVKARYNLGLALEKQGRVEEAIHCYRQVVNSHPDFSLARLSLGQAYLKLGDSQSAWEQYRKLKESSPELAQNFGKKISSPRK